MYSYTLEGNNLKMMWLPFKKRKQDLTISLEAKKRIEVESEKQGKPQVLLLNLERDQNGLGSVLVGFTDKTTSDLGLVRWQNQTVQRLLSLGELQFESGKFFFYPNVDLVWEKTPRSEIHKLISNYEFTKDRIYLEEKDFIKLRTILSECFQREGVRSVYLHRNVCQLEILNLTEEKEEKISMEILTYFSSLFESPWKE
ncbi:hypothetical protein ND861_05350 [Leptospira sp. 2 VSF19]|uniref:Uncharacterized protein n=1 Tax=Leptospira soteropolitanensis TaxID=2950025 RepID=A0AAW5VET5_9LEPT|nr:hypothetical protein [Leptospira soteropolitanensis]MCW7492078.1 hypothetical protein [Leptospira soteropolitanensis]MCW7499660.1 hypothetical protein [Leptospira soteropolitanensis]MCW7521911.1 hypothetical protein [Leptospira soteropolitanensis]MCW7525765.1 hypothetical protein [Leptospira soteropolitanensis]MCW7530121.1 hypothetical protein [Leptospira soteropolitanensis]